MDKAKQRKIARILSLILPFTMMALAAWIARFADLTTGLVLVIVCALWEGCLIGLLLDEPRLKCPNCGRPLGSFSGELDVVAEHGVISIKPTICRFCQIPLVVKARITGFDRETPVSRNSGSSGEHQEEK